jgi:hypothetical protein
MKDFNEIKSILAAIQDDCVKFYEKHNKSAGTRIRKAMQNIKVLAQAIRTDIQNRRVADKNTEK